MRKRNILKGKMFLFLISAILILCLGFFAVGCGVGPAQKAVNTVLGNFALDYTDCPVPTDCIVVFNSAHLPDGWERFEGKPLTLEAWVQPKNNSNGNFVNRLSTSRGAGLHASSTAAVLTPQFTIRRVVASAHASGTSTVAYTVDSTQTIALDAWTHVAGILTNDDHSAVGGHPVCVGQDGDATDDPWHLDIYIDGAIEGCSHTYGNQTAYGAANGDIEVDPTAPADAYAHEPAGHLSTPGYFYGLIDEARVWSVDRTPAQLDACDGQALTNGGACNLGSADLITYHNFNAGTGHTVYDRSGALGTTGGKEYQNPNFDPNFPNDPNEPEWLPWEDGWEGTDTPF